MSDSGKPGDLGGIMRAGDRRRFLKGAGAAVGLASLPGGAAFAQSSDVPVDCRPAGIPEGAKTRIFKPDESLPLRVRKSAFELTTAEIDRLRRAYKALRDLSLSNPNDPRGWLQQSYLHCWHCGGGTDGKSGVQVHFGWHFEPWHRAYLYFHERILAKLINDDSFALPYWDWDSQARQQMPPPYCLPNVAYDLQKPSEGNPLVDARRGATPGLRMTDQVLSPDSLSKVMSSPRSDLYLGYRTPTDPTTPTSGMGAMEGGPHNMVHGWTGQPSMEDLNGIPDMGVLATAARDPIFFSHHNNIDRLWGVWLGLSPLHRNFTEPEWLSQRWDFCDENGVWTSIAIQDVLDAESSLKYRFDAPNQPPIWTFASRAEMAAAAAPATAATIASVPKLLGKPLEVAKSARSGGSLVLKADPLTRTITLTDPVIAALKAAPSHPTNNILLRIEGIAVRPTEGARFNVFVNTPDATAGTLASAPRFVGTVGVLAMTNDRTVHNHGLFDAVLDLTPELGDLEFKDRKLSITLTPFTAKGQPPTGQGISFERIVILSDGA